MAIITIEPSDPRPIYQQIIDEIRRALVVGSLRADEPLPSVRRLAADLRVNPNTVQQAYRELERDGVVYVRRGMGTFVAGLSSIAEERRTLARSLAGRTLREAYRHGLDIDDLITALRQAARSQEGGPDSSEESS
nr:HTH-type transcriptional repressor YtrA-like [Nerophis lumbriciformis]